MKSIKLRVLLLLLYLVVLGVYLYPKGASLSDPACVQWLAVMGGTLLVIVLLFLVLRYKGGKTKCYITTELKTHCKSLCVRAFGRFAR